MIKKEMWVLESTLSIREIVAIYDEVKNKVECYAYKDECYEDGSLGGDLYYNYPDETYYETEDDAIKARNKFIQEAKEMMPKVKEFIERMSNLNEDSEIFPFDRHDYLGTYANQRKISYYKEYQMEYNVNVALARAFNHGTANINAETVKVDEVVRVEWGQYKEKNEKGESETHNTATLVLRDGHEIRTRSSSEYRLVELLFGENLSDRIFNCRPLEK